jgi:uncharacterized glyoxalase superfamily protein PhnB
MSDLPARLSLVTIGARDIPAMRAFYRGLGFETTVEADDGFTAYMAGGVVLSLYPIDSLGDLSKAAVPPADTWSGMTLAINMEEKEQVDTAFAAAIAAGAIAIVEPYDLDWGGRTSIFADPEGNRWEIAWVSGVEFDERGAVTRFGG